MSLVHATASSWVPFLFSIFDLGQPVALQHLDELRLLVNEVEGDECHRNHGRGVVKVDDWCALGLVESFPRVKHFLVLAFDLNQGLALCDQSKDGAG